MDYQIVLTGIGGQGVIFLVKLLGECAKLKGIPFLGTETHGMAQRGGTVVCFVKFGNFYAPLIEKGSADLLIGLYPSETLRFLEYLKENGKIVTHVTNDYKDYFTKIPFESFLINAEDILRQNNLSLKSLNVFILGKVLKEIKNFPFSKDIVLEALNNMYPKVFEINKQALELGLKN
jgi:indolepyruvate ferredoxin oxidoreductase beta subunit